MKKISYVLLVFLFAFSSVSGQSECKCCSEFHQQFDFWVGRWIVKDTTGNKVGENVISKLEGNCVVQEKWEGVSGTTGMSINYYDPLDDTWNQLWVDNGGNILKLKGVYDSNQMLLKSDLITINTQQYYNQIAWTPNDDGTVTQLWQTKDSNGNLLQTLFKGIYTRISD